VAEAFKGVAQVAGYLAAVRTVKVDSKAAAPTQCAADGTYVFIFDTPVQGAIVCDITVNITAIGTPPTTGHSRGTGQAQSGVFYRQNLPYLMTADGSDVHTAAFVYSPTESPTYFLPISRTFFSNNSAEFGFAEGMPKTYKQETQGEIVALLKIPADVVAAYFAAMGSLFDAFKSRDSKEAEVLAGSVKLELAKQKYDACIAAIKANDQTRIKELACGP